MEFKRVPLTEKSINNSQASKKRTAKVAQWKDISAKISKNSGEPYTSRNGSLKPGPSAPSGGKACGPSCTRPGCIIGLTRQLQIHEDFWSSSNYDIQTALLFGFARKNPASGPNSIYTTYTYCLPSATGVYVEVCRKTLESVLGVTTDRVKKLKERISTGRLLVQDGRGLHDNRPHSIPPETRDAIRSHIRSFPSELSHYTRNYGDPERRYLDKELTPRKMFDLYHAAVGAEADSHFWLYCQELRNSGLIIGAPRSDTCSTCDRLYIEMTNTTSQVETDRIEWESLQHHIISDAAFASLRDDVTRNISDPNFNLFCFDLQQVLFCPLLTHSDYFYQRKYSCYNLAITNPTETYKSYMIFWHESIARKGSNEIASCFFKMVTTQFSILATGEKRTLTTYSDRCTGQNCNWVIMCMFRYLIELGYFTEVTHKFMTTGHSFLPCDREFAPIEKKKKTSAVFVPEDWVKVIEEAKSSNEVTVMSQQDFLSFESIKRHFKQPRSLKITEILGIRMTSAHPNTIFTRLTHEPDTTWDEHRVENRCTDNIQNIQPEQMYNAPLAVSEPKKNDLQAMCPYLQPQFRQFYQDL